MVNGPKNIFVERKGNITRANIAFEDDEHVMRILDRIVAPLGRRIDESSPLVDARLPDGSRVNAVIRPISLVGPTITIRKFFKKPLTTDDLIQLRLDHQRNRRIPARLHHRAPEHGRLRRHGFGQDDAAQRAFELHPQ